jgi:hypothetical protein
MCGLERYADAIVGSLGVEHRKRTTIGVELAAKVRNQALGLSLTQWHYNNISESPNCFYFWTNQPPVSTRRVLGLL